MVYPLMGYYLAVRNEVLIDAIIWMNLDMDEPWKHFAKWKKSVTKDLILYDSIYIRYPE